MHVALGIVPPGDVRAAAAVARDEVERPPGELDAIPAEDLMVPLIRLGNLTTPNAMALCEALPEPVADLATAAPVRLAGAWVLENDEPGVGLRLQGDVDAIHTLARRLPPIVADHGYYVDRRSFQPFLPLATITDATTLPYLERLATALEAHHGREWVVDGVQVLTRTWAAGSSGGWRVLATVPTTR